jgi:hypothetical protein
MPLQCAHVREEAQGRRLPDLSQDVQDRSGQHASGLPEMQEEEVIRRREARKV